MRALVAAVVLLASCSQPVVTPSPSATAFVLPTPPSLPSPTVHPRPSSYTTLSGEKADVLGEPGIARADLARVLAQAEISVPAIERDAGRAFNLKPTIYLF